MNHYRKVSIEDQALFNQTIRKLPFYQDYLSSELVFLNLLAWSKDECIEIMWKDEIGYIRCLKHDVLWFFPPVASSIELLIMGINHIKTYYPTSRIIGITEAMKKYLDLPDTLFLLDDKLSEYIYDTNEFIQMKGQAYHRKRNLISQFIKKYSYRFLRYQKEMKSLLLDFIERYKNQGGAIDDLDAFYKTLSLLDQGLDYQCYVLKVDNLIVGVTIGIITESNIGIVLFEKADYTFIGSYQMISYQMASQVFSETRFLNRQEDVGLPELRRAKLSYQPLYKDTKYALHFNPLMIKSYALYEEAFPEDSKAYRDYFFLHHHKENNMRYILEDGFMKACLHIKINSYKYVDKVIEIPLIVGAATAKSYRRQGYMKRLLDAFIQECKIKNIPWIVLKTEIPRVYQASGFIPVGRMEKVGHYEKLENCQIEQTSNMTLLKSIYDTYFMDKPHDIRDVTYFQDLVYALSLEGYETYIIKHDKEILGYVIDKDGSVEEMLLLKKVNPIIKDRDYKDIYVPSDKGIPSHMIYPIDPDLDHHLVEMTFMNQY